MNPTHYDRAFDASKFIDTFNVMSPQYVTQFKNDCILYFDGGKFTIDRALIVYAKTLQDDEIIIDDHLIPVKISSAKDFNDNLLQVYERAVNAHYERYKLLENNHRTVHSIIK